MSGDYKFCWLNGRMLAAGEARIDPDDRGFLLADGVFETILLRHGKAIWWEEHIRRLRHGARALGISLPWESEALTAAVAELVDANHLQEVESAVLRMTLSRGVGARGLAPMDVGAPTLLLRASAMPPRKQSLRGVTARSVRRNVASLSSRLKTLSYVDGVLAQREATASGVEAALLLNDAGRLTCAANANLFVWRDGVLLTPPLEEGCLEGIARQHLLAAARDLGLSCQESALENSLRQEDCALLTNSLQGAVRLSELDGVALRNSNELDELLNAFSKRMM